MEVKLDHSPRRAEPLSLRRPVLWSNGVLSTPGDEPYLAGDIARLDSRPNLGCGLFQ
jgi:hypothetical protein